ncbi:MAG: S8 family serine peptidase [Bacteroidales bacterium]|nr:S8 family serine peptidase [Bacteroidales bacterium]
MKKHILSLIFAFTFGALFSQSLTESYVNGYRILKGERPEINVRDFPTDVYARGKIKIKIDRSYEVQLPDVVYRAGAQGFVTTGIVELDALNAQFRATSYTPSFGMLYETNSRCNNFRERHKAWGFHLWFTIELDETVSIADAVESYQALSFVEIAEPFYKIVLHADPIVRWTPDDPQIGNQWHYKNIGQAGGTPGCDISLFDAWEIEKGNSDVVVAIVDCGVNKNHPDLAGNMWGGNAMGGYNFYNNSPTVNPGDHGCHTGGTVSAVTNNNVGVAGVAGGSGSNDGVRLMTCQIFPPNGMGAGGVKNAFIYSADNGACISQNSWGYNYPGMYDQAELDGIDYFNANGGGDVMTNGIVIFAAGNSSGSGMYYPGCYSQVLAVAATNNKDVKAGYSNFGTWVQISAPGGVTNYSPTNPAGVLSCTVSGYAYYEGTSMACPHVSGVAALLVSKAARHGYKFSRQEVWDLLLNNVDNHYPVNPSYTGMLGTGRLNAHKALLAMPDFAQGIVFEDFIVNDSEGNDNGRLNPGETVHLTVSMKSLSNQPITDVQVTLSIADALVTIVNGTADFGDFAAEEIKTVEDAFTITLSEDAVNGYEIAALLEAAFEGMTEDSEFSIPVYDYTLEIMDIQVANESGEIEQEEATDIWIYLQNTGDEDALSLTAELSTTVPYLTINTTTAYYGHLYTEQYKYRIYNVTLNSDVPEGTTSAPITLTITDISGRVTEIDALLYFKNDGEPPQPCNPIEDLSAAIVDSDIVITWAAPSEGTPEKYLVYCNDMFLIETTETTCTLTNAEIQLYHFCVEALYDDGCTSELICTDIMPCDMDIVLTIEYVGEDFHLSWLPVVENVKFKIFKNTELLVEIEGNEYIDTEVESGATYCYTVTAVCHGGTESEPSNEVCKAAVGINELKNDIKIYPNPTDGQLKIENGELKIENVEIYDVMGRKQEIIFNFHPEFNSGSTFNLTNLPTGVYFLKIQTETGVVTQKIVKQ